MVSGGLKTAESMRKEQKDLIPKGVDWLRSKAKTFDPDNNKLTLDNGETIKYEYLIVATGIRIDFDEVNIFNQLTINSKVNQFSFFFFFLL